MEIVIDLRSFETVEEFHKYISEKLNFSEHYGYNLDALNDEVSSLSGISFSLIRGGQIPEEVQDAIESILCEER